MKKKIIILTCILLPILIFVVYYYSFDYYAFKDYELKIPRSINKNTIIMDKLYIKACLNGLFLKIDTSKTK